MGWFTKFVSVIPVLGNIVDAGVRVVDEIRSDPKLKLNALRKIDEESQRRHNEAIAKLKEMQSEYDADFRKREDAANERIRIQKEENDKIIKEMTEKSREQDQKHDEDVRKMNEDHSNKVKEMRSESKEARDKAEMEHRMKVGMMELEHKKEKAEAEKKLTKAKEEGLEKIAVAEKEKDALADERNRELAEYIEASKALEEAHQKSVLEIRKRNNDIRLENMKLKREQLALQNKKVLEESHQFYLDVISTLTIENSRNVIKKFEAITTHITPVQTSLENIKLLCLPPPGAEPDIMPGELDEDFKSIRAATNSFEYSKRMFNQYLINTNLTDRRLLDTCSKLITDMSNLMSQEELSAICVHLPRAIDNKNMRVIMQYGDICGKQNDKFFSLQNRLTEGVGHLQRNHIPAVTNSETNAIEQ